MPFARPVASPRGRAIAQGVGAVLAAGLLAPATLLAAMIASASMDWPRGATIALWSAAMLVVVAPAVAILARLALSRPKLGRVRAASASGAGVVAAFALLGALPSVFFGSIWGWSMPIVRAGWDFCGTGDASLVIMGLPLTGLFVGLAALVAFPVVARSGSEGSATLLGPVLGGAALFATIALGAFVLTLAPRLDRPAADDWVSTLPVVAHVPAAGTSEFVGTATTRLDERVSLERVCTRDRLDDRSYCHLRLIQSLPGGATLPGAEHESSLAPDGELEVSRDAAHDLWLVSREWDVPRAFRGIEPSSVEPFDVADAIAPPGPAIVAGVVGAAVALLLLLLRLVLAWRARAIRGGREGRADGHGIAFDDGELPARGALAVAVPEGPVVAFRARTSHAHYRDDGTRAAWRVTSGSRAALLEALRTRTLACDAMALAIALIALTPLLVVSRTLLLG